jgi:hypothetical protein
MNNTNLKSLLNGKIKPNQPQSEPAEEKNVSTVTSLVESDYAVLTNNALDIIGENLKNQPLSLALFDIVKSPSGGATVFAVPGLAGEEAEKELSGIILDYTTPRAYWETPEPIEGEPPVCFSRDSLVSHEGKPCSRCPFNDFGSKDGDSNAKACKESVLIFLLRPGNIMPTVVRVPVTSKLIFQRYMTRLIGRMIPLNGVVTKITLEKATSKQGKPYALYSFEAVSMLSHEETLAAKAFGQRFMEIINADEDAFEPDMQEAS